jgi:hypothetical protein
MNLNKQPILNTNATLNNRRYPLEVLVSIKDQIIEMSSKQSAFGTVGYDSESLEKATLNVSKIAFEFSNPLIENETLYVDIKTLETPEGQLLRSLLESEIDLRFRPSGMASLVGEMPQEVHNLLDVPKHVSSDYKLIGLAAINPEEDALQF